MNIKGPNPILESLIRSRLDDVEMFISKQDFVKKGDREFYNVLDKIKDLVPDDLFMELESAGNGMQCDGIKAGYTLGIVEGVSLMQEIKSIFGEVKISDE